MVEKYFNTELSDIVFEAASLDEWKDIVDELGLTEQVKLSKGKLSPIPFPFMNTTMQRVCETLCPRKVDFREYDKTPIPLEVLQQIKLCVNDNHFQKIEVWYDDKSPDPFIIGKTGYYYSYNDKMDDAEGNNLEFSTEEELHSRAKEVGLERKDYNCSYSTKDSYLVARWGDELRDFKELKKLAIERFIDEAGTQMRKSLNDIQEKLNTLETNAASFINGDISAYEAKRT